MQTASNNTDWIHYVGPKFGKDRVKYFKISSVQLMPGLVGLGILDSFALETPIITTKYKYHSPEIEYLNNENNGIITEDSVDIYVRKLIQVLKSEQYLSLIEECRSSSETYTIETMVTNFKNGIVSCMNGN